MLHKTALLSLIATAAFALVVTACVPLDALAPTEIPIPQNTAIIPNMGAKQVPAPAAVAVSSTPATSVSAPASATPTPTPTATFTSTPVPPTATATATPTAPSTPVPTQTTAAVLPSGPFIQIIYPASGGTVLAGQQIVVQSTASGAAGLAHVDLWVDGALYASTANPLPGGTTMAVAQPWSTSSAGSHTLAVVAYDVLGRASLTATAILQVPSAAAPTAWFAQPYTSNNNVVLQVGDSVLLDYWGSAAAGVARLELWVDGNLVYSDSNSTSSMQMEVQHTWSSDTIGEHSLVARVYDTQNQTTDSTPLVIGLTDRNAPSATIVSPVDHSQVPAGQTVLVTVSASDTKGITHLELWADNSLINSWNSAQSIGQSTATVYFAWTSPSAGNHSLYVIADDSVGLSSTTTPILVSVVSQAPTSTPTATATPTATSTPTMTPTSTPMPTMTATSAPTLAPTNTPAPTMTATSAPTLAPTSTPAPTMTATSAPTLAPTNPPAPTKTATSVPTLAPTSTPAPTMTPSPVPTATLAPTLAPTPTASATPTATLTMTPTVTLQPTD